MRVRLKRVNEQVIVITGGSSGIGLATAQLAAHTSSTEAIPVAIAPVT